MSLKLIASKFSFPHAIHILLNIRIILRSIIHVHPQDTERAQFEKIPTDFVKPTLSYYKVILPQNAWHILLSNQTADLAPAFSSPPN